MSIKDRIRVIADKQASVLQKKIDDRVEEMESDNNAHYLIYRVLGVTHDEGKQIDIYQNKGRFLYNHAGKFLEKAALLCFSHVHPDSGSFKIPNTISSRPKTFQIDCLVGNDAIEIKWRDATTDGDHVVKEDTRIRVISDAGYKPVRVMFFYPNRKQSIRIQETLQDLYTGLAGEYHFGDGAWDYILNRTGVNLKQILEELAEEKTNGA